LTFVQHTAIVPTMRGFTAVCVLFATMLSSAASAASATAAGPAPGTPEYLERDAQNMRDAYGRQTAPDGQLSPAYITASPAKFDAEYLRQVADQAANPTRPVLDPGQLVPGWNQGNPYRYGWAGTRGQQIPVAFTNRYGALLRGHVYAPLPGARDPYTGAALSGPYPAVLITTGSVQGSENMYEWLAQDLAERGYVAMTYDVQGQGTSETLPHGQCCPGVPSQQLGNFTTGTEDALDFFTSRANPYRSSLDLTRDPHPATRGRTTRIAIVGHSLGATAVSQVQRTDRRVATVVALDKLSSADTRPAVPALAVQSEYFFEPTPALSAPDPGRERGTGYDAWRRAGVDSMLVVPRASTHLEYTDIPLVLPASRYGQDLTSVYVQRWLDRYLKHRSAAPLLARSFRYLEPVGHGTWSPVTLRRDDLLSSDFCSAYALTTRSGRVADGDVIDVGC
jgi:hypothetical protein